jgi:hypothetical protein
MVQFIRINKDGSMNDIQETITEKNICKKLQNVCTSQGNKKIQELYTWNYNNHKLICYGWIDGEAGFENKHDLPPSGISNFLDEDSSTILLYGDLFIVYSDNKKFINFEVSDYSVFYSEIFEGFDDCEEEDDDGYENESHEEDESYDGNEDEEDEEPFEYLTDTELDKSDEEKDLEEDITEY